MADPLRPAPPAPAFGDYCADDGAVFALGENDDAKPAIDCGHDVYLSADERPKWFHRCGVLGPDGHRRAWIFVACGLAPGHVVTRNAAGLVTIRASILCLRCGTHGWLTDSKWTPC